MKDSYDSCGDVHNVCLVMFLFSSRQTNKGILWFIMWVFPRIGVPPNHPILIGFSIINHPFWGTLFLETPICWWFTVFILLSDHPVPIRCFFFQDWHQERSPQPLNYHLWGSTISQQQSRPRSLCCRVLKGGVQGEG